MTETVTPRMIKAGLDAFNGWDDVWPTASWVENIYRAMRKAKAEEDAEAEAAARGKSIVDAIEPGTLSVPTSPFIRMIKR